MKFDIDKEWCLNAAKLEEEAGGFPIIGGHQQRKKKNVAKLGKKLKALEEKMAALHEQMKKEGQAAFNEAIKEVFEAHPEIEAFRWSQYTPYFNDGDTCEFGVNTDVDLLPVNKAPLPHVEKDKYRYRQEDEWYCGSNGMPYEYEAASNDFSAVLRIEELMLALFGDHGQITCYRDRIEVEEYQHD